MNNQKGDRRVDAVVAVLLIFGFICSFVSAQGAQGAHGSLGQNPSNPTPSQEIRIEDTDLDKWANDLQDSSYWKKQLVLWINGVRLDNEGDVKSVSLFLRFSLLLIVIMLIFSSLESLRFPDNVAVRFIIAILTGVISVLFIPMTAIISAMSSYSAMGMAFIIFFPIMILGFFTYMVILRANAVGIFLQRILWLIYSLYLFFQSFRAWAANQLVEGAASGTLSGENLSYVLIKFSSKDSVTNIANNTDSTTSLILLFTAIAVFIIMVLGNKKVREYMDEQIRESAKTAMESIINKAKEYDRTKAKAFEDAAKKT